MYSVSENINTQYETYSLEELLKEFLPKRIATKLWVNFKDKPLDLLKLTTEELIHEHSLSSKHAHQFKAILSFSNKMRELKEIQKEKVLASYSLAKTLQQKIGSKDQEHLVALYLNTQNEIIEEKTLFIGSINQSIADPKVILHHALKNLATSIIISHNHPSGCVTPSPLDNTLTSNLEFGCKMMNIKLLDHIIVSKDDYYSYREDEKLK